MRTEALKYCLQHSRHPSERLEEDELAEVLELADPQNTGSFHAKEFCHRLGQPEVGTFSLAPFYRFFGGAGK